jgi:subtilisin family serine protease
MQRVRVGSAVLVATAVGAGLAAAPADRTSRRTLPDAVARLRLASPETSLVGRLDASLVGSQGPQQVIVRLRTPAVADVNRAPESTLRTSRDVARVNRRVAIDTEQQAFLSRRISAIPGAQVIAQTRLVLNAVFLQVDAAHLSAIAADPAVLRVAPVGNYQVALSETVPYIGASSVQAQGYDGSGVRVAVLDSGIDYTHAHFGGSGDPADHAANDPSVVEPGSFPTAKVVGGYDFVGSAWPVGALAPDPDPLDDGVGGGHGTHVADIAGGLGGVAPGADLYAVKVCSSVSTSCSGVALIQGMEFAVDPNGDLDPRDHVDVVNMSLGADYGQPFDDDLSLAVENATALGVLSVVAAGNGSDKPYIQGTPAGAPSALSVAQTHVPSAFLPFMEVLDPPEGNKDAVFQSWSATLAATISGPVTYGDGAGGNLNGCAAFAPGSLAGQIVAVDRGICNFTLKIKNIGDAGGALGIIMLVAPGAPFNGADGGDAPITIPGYMINQADGNILRTGSAVVSFDPTNGLALVGSMVSSSSRGPQIDDNRIKPEIGAPGASVSAEYGTGTGATPFGGTSGATPMVAGSAALLLDAYPHRSPLEVKALLMNTADANVLNTVPGDSAPISRIGAGEVRVDRALRTAAAAWDAREPTAGLSFGFEDVTRRERLKRRVVVKNYSKWPVLYEVESSFRFDDDAASGAVRVHTPRFLWVPGRKHRSFDVSLKIDGAQLPGNSMNSGAEGANPGALTLNEYDGYVTLTPFWGHGETIHLPWHVLPRKAAEVKTVPRRLTFASGNPTTVRLLNKGVGTAQNDSYSLIALSENIPEGAQGEQMPTPDIRAVGVNTFIVSPTFCTSEFVWAFSVNTWERQTHLIPVTIRITLDIDRDGTDDYWVLTRDLSLNNITDGRILTWSVDLNTGSAQAFFFAEHSTNTGNTSMYVCGEQVGLTGSDILATNVNVRVFADDFYYGGPGDVVPEGADPLTITPLGEQYFGIPSDVPGRSSGDMAVHDFGAFPGNTPELGLLLVTNGDRGAGARGGATEATEATILALPGVDVPKKKTKRHHHHWKH